MHVFYHLGSFYAVRSLLLFCFIIASAGICAQQQQGEPSAGAQSDNGLGASAAIVKTVDAETGNMEGLERPSAPARPKFYTGEPAAKDGVTLYFVAASLPRETYFVRTLSGQFRALPFESEMLSTAVFYPGRTLDIYLRFETAEGQTEYRKVQSLSLQDADSGVVYFSPRRAGARGSIHFISLTEDGHFEPGLRFLNLTPWSLVPHLEREHQVVAPARDVVLKANYQKTHYRVAVSIRSTEGQKVLYANQLRLDPGRQILLIAVAGNRQSSGNVRIITHEFAAIPVR